MFILLYTTNHVLFAFLACAFILKRLCSTDCVVQNMIGSRKTRPNRFQIEFHTNQFRDMYDCSAVNAPFTTYKSLNLGDENGRGRRSSVYTEAPTCGQVRFYGPGAC